MMYKVLLSCMLLLITSPAYAQDVDQPTRIEWIRRGPTSPVKVTGTKTGGRHAQANKDLQNLANILDGIRTVEHLVLWHRITWRDGRMAIEAVAKSAALANVATIALRRFYPKHGSAGTGIKQMRGAVGYRWQIRAKLNPKREPERR